MAGDAERNFWIEWGKVGQDLLEYGQEVQYGNSLVEVKFMQGVPAVIIRSKSVKKKYPDDSAAKMAVAQVLEDSETASFDGARTWTVAYNRGHITHIQLDEYSNRLVK